MSILMCLEVEEGVPIAVVEAILRASGERWEEGPDRLEGVFERSWAVFAFRREEPARDVGLDHHGVDWKVGLSGVFHCANNRLAESWGDIHHLIVQLAAATSARFLLSFQYESLYAYRDHEGLTVVQAMVLD